MLKTSLKIIVLVILTSTISFAQTKDSIAKNKIVSFEETLRIYYINTNQFGNTTLAKDHVNDYGIGSSISLISVMKFQLNFGLEYARYKITNQENTGLFTESNYRNLYVSTSYPFSLSEKIKISPLIGIGGVSLKQREKYTRQSYQNGTNYRIGVQNDYTVSGVFSVYLGIEYIYTNFKIKTIPEFENYYGLSNNLQLTLGIKLH